MKNAKLKIKNENENWKLGNEESPMLAGCSSPSVSGAEQVQSLKFKVQSWEAEGGDGAEFEDFRLNTSFSADAECGKSGKHRTSNVEHRMKEAGDEDECWTG